MSAQSPPPMAAALAGIRICDFTGQLAGAGATQVARRVRRRGDPHRGSRPTRALGHPARASPPFVDDRRGSTSAAASTTTTSSKLGITLNLRTARGQELLAATRRAIGRRDRELRRRRARALGLRLRAPAGAAAGHHLRLELRLRPHRPVRELQDLGADRAGGVRSDVHVGPARTESPRAGATRTWITPADTYMAMAILLALLHRKRTGEGQWVDLACCEAGAHAERPGAARLHRQRPPAPAPGQPNSNRSEWPRDGAARHLPRRRGRRVAGDRLPDDADWEALRRGDRRGLGATRRLGSTLAGRLADAGRARRAARAWTRALRQVRSAAPLPAAGVPAAAVQKPEERIDRDPATRRASGSGRPCTTRRWATSASTAFPCILARPTGEIARGGPCLGEHNEEVLTSLLGLGAGEIAALREEGVI